jgi:hypothetical protein
MVGQHQSAFAANPTGRNPAVAFVEARRHLRLLRPGHQPEDAPRAIENGIGQGHSAPSLINAGESDVVGGHVDHRVSGDERRGMAVGPEAEKHEVEHRGRAGDLPERQRVGCARRFQTPGFDRHGVNLIRRDRAMREQALAQVGEVSVGVSRRRHALVDLYDIDALPRNIFVGEGAEH